MDRIGDVWGERNPFGAGGDWPVRIDEHTVETPERDIAHGVDRLLGESEQLLRTGFEGGAERLVDRLESHDDDRALLLLHRR